MPDLSIISDVLLAAGALSAAVYCAVLARRLKRFNNLQHGMGGAVAVLSAQVDDMTRTLQKAQKAAVASSHNLIELTERAESVSRQLELMLASMHDLPQPDTEPDAPETTQSNVTPEPRSHSPSNAAKSDAESHAKRGADEAVPIFLSKRRAVMEAAE